MYSWVRNNEILRQTPRHNPAVNEYWMCDAGRLGTFAKVNAESRLRSPLVKRDGTFREAGWDEVIARVASEFKSFKKSEIAVLGSANSTNEDLFAISRFAREMLTASGSNFRVPQVNFYRAMQNREPPGIAQTVALTANGPVFPRPFLPPPG